MCADMILENRYPFVAVLFGCKTVLFNTFVFLVLHHYRSHGELLQMELAAYLMFGFCLKFTASFRLIYYIYTQK